MNGNITDKLPVICPNNTDMDAFIMDFWLNLLLKFLYKSEQTRVAGIQPVKSIPNSSTISNPLAAQPINHA